METRKKVLIVEDKEQLQTLWRRQLSRFDPSVEVLNAGTVKDALRIISEHSDLALVVLDGSLGAYDFDTEPVLERLMEIRFRGPILAASSLPDVQSKLLSGGCTAAVEKKFVAQNVIAHLKDDVRPKP